MQPAASWDELVEHTEFLYQAAHETRLRGEKFMLDGRHTGTGGGNHFVLGGATPSDSPFLRRPDLLASMLAYWHNSPANRVNSARRSRPGWSTACSAICWST